MSVAAFAFYVFALTVLVGGLFTVVSRNPVHSEIGRASCRERVCHRV